MNKKMKVVASTLIVSSMLTLCSFADYSEGRELSLYGAYEAKASPIGFERYEYTTNKVSNKSIWAHTRLKLVMNRKELSTDARLINGVPYVALRSFIGELGNMSVTYRSDTRTMSISGNGLVMDVIDGSNVIYANGRTLFSMSPSTIMTNGRMYSPISEISKALGLKFSHTAGAGINITGSVKAIESGSTFYDKDAVYWLSRIISAESRGESLLGQIAVGNVVLNRVKSPLYPNTIWGVIFDRKYGVQFSPVLDGSVYSTPAQSAVVAAKICLDGYNITNSALFFLHPKYSTSSWIPNNRDYLFTIGKHDFYA